MTVMEKTNDKEQLKLKLPTSMLAALDEKVGKVIRGKTVSANRQSLIRDFVEAGLAGLAGNPTDSVVGVTLAAIQRASTTAAKHQCLRQASTLTGWSAGTEHVARVRELWTATQAAPDDEHSQVELALRLLFVPRTGREGQVLYNDEPVRGATWFVVWIAALRNTKTPPYGVTPTELRWAKLRGELQQGHMGHGYPEMLEAVLHDMRSWCEAGDYFTADQFCWDVRQRKQFPEVLAGALLAIATPYKQYLTEFEAFDRETRALLMPKKPEEPVMSRDEGMRYMLMSTDTDKLDVPFTRAMVEWTMTQYAQRDEWLLGHRCKQLVAMVRKTPWTTDDLAWCDAMDAARDRCVRSWQRVQQEGWLARERAKLEARRDAARAAGDERRALDLELCLASQPIRAREHALRTFDRPVEQVECEDTARLGDEPEYDDAEVPENDFTPNEAPDRGDSFSP
jgi:hypothetical protein